MLALFLRQSAVEFGQLGCPFGVSHIFPRANIDANGAIFCRAGFVPRTRVHISTPGDLKSDKTGDRDRGLQLCFQQSTGYSTRPQVDLGFRAFRYCPFHQDIPNLQPAAGTKHTRHFTQPGFFIGHEIQYAVGDDHVCPTVGHR